MAYWVSSVVRGNTVGYPSDSLASYFYFLLFLMCHYAVNWCDKLYVCHFLLVVLWNRAFIYISFWIYWALTYCNILVEKRHYFFRGCPDLRQ